MAKAKRKPRCEMPEMIPDTPQNVARVVQRTRPPKDGGASEGSESGKLE